MSFCFRESFALILLLLMAIFALMIGLDAGPHMTIICCIAITGIAGRVKKYSWEQMEEYLIQGVAQCMKAVFILSLIGALISAWMLSGTIPTIFSYGLQVLNPDWFLVTSLFVCIVVSCFTGSSLTTAGTVGVALMGIAQGFGLSAPMTAGAVICGACFGDKLSPLSDTTNFSSGIVGVELFAHIRHLLWTTIPALCLTVLAFILIGKQGGVYQESLTSEATAVLRESFSLTPLTLLSPCIVMVLAFRRFPTLPVLMAGVLTALLTTGLVQNNWDFPQWFSVLTSGFSLETSSDIVNRIVNRGGIMSMMFSVSLVITALAFGGLLQGMGIISSLMDGIKNKIRKKGSVIFCATASSVGINFLTGEQYLSILLPGQAFRPVFKEQGIKMMTLSRALEDGGTLINPLVPWGVCGAFFSGTLGVPVASYLPYTFFLYLSPVFTVLLGYLQNQSEKVPATRSSEN